MAFSKSLVLSLLFTLISNVLCSGGGGSVVIEEHEMSHEEMICADKLHYCHEHHAIHVRGDIAMHYTPHQLEQYCMDHKFGMCMDEVKGNCSEIQLLKIESVLEAEDYVCSKDGLKDYAKGSWEKLGNFEVSIENDMCTDQFLIGANHHLREFMELDDIELPSDLDERTELLDDVEQARRDCCGHFQAYLKCEEGAVTRQTDTELGEWQYEVLSKFYTPQYETCECKIGKGMTIVFRNAMIIVAVLMGFIFGLATTCGCLQCCGEKMKLCRRRCRQMCYCCYTFEEDDEYFERKYEAKLNALYGGEDNLAYDRKSFQA